MTVSEENPDQDNGSDPLEGPSDYEDLFENISSTDDLPSDDELLREIDADEEGNQ